MKHQSIQIILKPEYKDSQGEIIRKKIFSRLGLNTGEIRISDFYIIDYILSERELLNYSENCLKNKITDKVLINSIWQAQDFSSMICVSQKPGVTDDQGISAQMALADFLNIPIDQSVQHIFSQKIYYIKEALSHSEMHDLAVSLLANPLINHIDTFCKSNHSFDFNPYIPKVDLHVDETVEEISLEIEDQDLLKLSEDRILALSLEEMKAIRSYYSDRGIIGERAELGLGIHPTDLELEIFAQTWSEHCKHKEFNAEINYLDTTTGERKIINSLFKTYIKGSTDVITKSLEANHNHWLIKVFTDNAGTVRASGDKLFVWKVETHNSPSALDPYGGAITGILGVNRDIMGTGIGGAELMFNTNVLCFGPPDYDKPLLKGQLHPKTIYEGVVAGIEAGGNKSGIPTINGSILFDERFSGKPLVFCGTGGLMPDRYQGRNAWEKQIDPGDRIIMAGGRVGKDGIHGATFSSTEINEKSPVSAVQIGSPITQKKLSDFMIIAAEKGLIKCSTDNGAGGLSSSIGELAEITGGAVVELDKVPLKYTGLKPWEIFVSESQERMTIVVEPKHIQAFNDLAGNMEVEITDIGYFSDTGYLDVRFKTKTVCYIQIDFLHSGVPQKKMIAEYHPSKHREPSEIQVSDYNKILTRLLSSIHICSREDVIRQYDHEVKGRTILKPLMGEKGIQPQDAGVMRMDHDTYEGIAVSNGIMPKFGDIDAREMSKGAFDEAVRQIIAVGGQLPNTKPNDGIFWTVNDNFCVPDSLYDPKKNPDGKEKLAKLVQMCEGLYEMSTFFDIPMTSGKDSMKNDFKSEGIKISVPPTILYSMAAKIPDIRKTITSNFKSVGDYIYQVGRTYNELGGSEFYKLFGEIGAHVPIVRKEKAKSIYLKMMQANSLDLIESAHDLSDGGLGVGISESLFGSGFGAEIELQVMGDLSVQALLFSESHSRFVVSVREENVKAFEEIFKEDAYFLGNTISNPEFVCKHSGKTIIKIHVSDLEQSWRRGI